MKRIIVFLLAAAMLVTLCACGKKKEEEIIGAGIVNPVKEQTEESLVQATGISLVPPVGAKDVSYQSIDAEATVSQMNFTLDGKKFTYRAMPSAEYKDISGMYYEWTSSDATGVGGRIAQISFIEGAQGIITWFDVVPGIVYSLSVESGATAEVLSNAANSVFSPVQGEVSGDAADIAIPGAPDYMLPAGFAEIASAISENYHQGTAGCSLRAAAYAAQLLDWFSDAGLSSNEVKKAFSDYSAGLSGDAASEFPLQIDGILAAVKQVSAKDGAAILLDCGYSSSRYPWDASAVNGLISALE